MKRRLPALCLALACACPVLTGCESFRHGLRHDSGAATNAIDAPAEHPEVKSDTPKGFFPNSRLSGAMSDEGRDVEKSLGIQ